MNQSNVVKIGGRFFVRGAPGLHNDTGIEPVEYKCLVELDVFPKKSSGGVQLPDALWERKQMAETKGTLLAVGSMAFMDWHGRIPQVGERVMIKKYAGVTREADPTDLCRVVNDKEILAVLT